MGNVSKTYDIHRLVALHFISNNHNKPQVNHKDGNKLNNNYKNLEWCTSKENVNHAIKNGLFIPHTKGKFGKDNILSKQIIQYDKYGRFIKIWDSMKDAEKAGISRTGNISRCCSGRIKTSGGYKWKYLNIQG